MDIELFENFNRMLEAGRKPEAAGAIRAFTDSFTHLEEKTVWARNYLANRDKSGTIRHELYEAVIFPVLLQGYRQSDPWSLRWLARTIHNLYQCKRLWLQIEMKTDTQLLAEILVLCPNDEEVRKVLLSKKIEWLERCMHEWPAGILYGMDGATSSECKEILQELDQVRLLDQE